MSARKEKKFCVGCNFEIAGKAEETKLGYMHRFCFRTMLMLDANFGFLDKNIPNGPMCINCRHQKETFQSSYDGHSKTSCNIHQGSNFSWEKCKDWQYKKE